MTRVHNPHFKAKIITQISLSLRETVTALIISNGVHEGVWQLMPRFDLTVRNILVGVDSSEQECPAVLSTLVGFGIERCKEPSQNAVDAALVNPKGVIVIPGQFERRES